MDTPDPTIEDSKRLTAEQLAATLETLDPSLQLTPEEQRQREAAWMLADAATWRIIAGSCVAHVVESYRRGDIDLREALDSVHRASIGCWTQDRLNHLGLTAARALRIVPLKRARGQRPPKWSLWVQNATAGLVLEGQARHPELRRTPLPTYNEDDAETQVGDGTSPLIAWALDILIGIGWFGEAGVPKPTTVDDWVRAWVRGASPPARDPQP